MIERIIILLLALFFSGCQKNPQENVLGNDQKFYLIAHAGAGDPFWSTVFTGANQAKVVLGVNVKILAPETPNDISRQRELLDAAIATKPGGIAISIPDRGAFSPSLKRAKGLGISVIAFNTRPLGTKEQNPYAAFVGMDDMLAGQKLAKKALRTNRITKKVVFAIHQPGHVGLEARFLGVKNILSKKGISTVKVDISNDASQAQQIIEGYLKKNPTTSAIFFAGAFGLHSLSQRLANRYPKIVQASFDLTPLTISQIKNKAVCCTVDQQPFMQGYMSINQLYLMNKFAIHPADINTTTAVIDENNAERVAYVMNRGLK